MIAIPPIECPTSTTGPVGHQLLEHPQQVVAELVDGGVLPVRASGAAVRALVEEHHPVLAAEVRALEVPAVEAQRVAVHEHDVGSGESAAAQSPQPLGGLGLGRVLGVRRDLVDLGVQPHAVLGEDRDRLAVQGPELVGTRSTPPGATARPGARRRHPAAAATARRTGTRRRDSRPTDACLICSTSPFDETCRRVNRPPIRVTIS